MIGGCGCHGNRKVVRGLRADGTEPRRIALCVEVRRLQARCSGWGGNDLSRKCPESHLASRIRSPQRRHATSPRATNGAQWLRSAVCAALYPRLDDGGYFASSRLRLALSRTRRRLRNTKHAAKFSVPRGNVDRVSAFCSDFPWKGLAQQLASATCGPRNLRGGSENRRVRNL